MKHERNRRGAVDGGRPARDEILEGPRRDKTDRPGRRGDRDGGEDQFDGRSRPRGGKRGEGRRGGGGRGRASRGDVRAAVLLLLAHEPMHGYQLMQAMAERTEGAWRPSSGVVYPTIGQLETEGLVDVSSDSGRKSVALTESGRAQAEALQAQGHDPFVNFLAAGPDLRDLLERLHAAAREIGRHGSPEHRKAAEKVLEDARRSLYLILAEQPSHADDESEKA